MVNSKKAQNTHRLSPVVDIWRGNMPESAQVALGKHRLYTGVGWQGVYHRVYALAKPEIETQSPLWKPTQLAHWSTIVSSNYFLILTPITNEYRELVLCLHCYNSVRDRAWTPRGSQSEPANGSGVNGWIPDILIHWQFHPLQSPLFIGIINN